MTRGAARLVARRSRRRADRRPQVGGRARRRLGDRLADGGAPTSAAGPPVDRRRRRTSPPVEPPGPLQRVAPCRSSGRLSPAGPRPVVGGHPSPPGRRHHADVAVLHARRPVGQQRGLGRGRGSGRPARPPGSSRRVKTCLAPNTDGFGSRTWSGSMSSGPDPQRRRQPAPAPAPPSRGPARAPCGAGRPEVRWTRPAGCISSVSVSRLPEVDRSVSSATR